MKVLTASQMQEVDRRTIEDVGIPGIVLMDNAGRAVADAIRAKFAEGRTKSALVLAGKGNNGGDGYVVARYLIDGGWQVQTLVMAERSAISGDALVALGALENSGGEVHFAADAERLEAFLECAAEPGVLVDAMFGTGLSKPIKGHCKVVIDWLNRQGSPVVAVDIPSGVDASTGRVPGVAVEADLTVTFAFPKVGLVSYPGAGLAGELMVVDIGVPANIKEEVSSDCRLIAAAEAKRLLPLRTRDGHKGTFGHLLVLAGALGKCGAAVMSAEAGLRSGAGLVTLGCPLCIQPAIAARLTEVMTVPLADFGGEVSMQALGQAGTLMDGKQAMAIGPGLGIGKEAVTLVRRMIQDSDLPLVVDADALTALCGHLEVLGRRNNRKIVLTPHPGELARLTGLSNTEIQKDRFVVAREFAMRHNLVLVLKGARTLVAAPDGRVHVNTSGHPGLASGGMGDVLTGLIGGLLAQGLAAVEAAVLGVYLHGLAADRLLETFGVAGLLATDVIRELPAARRALSKEN